MNAIRTGGTAGAWWRGWWAKLAPTLAAMDYSPTDCLFDSVARLEGEVHEIRAELDALKARGVEP